MKSLFTLRGKLNPASVKKYLTDENVVFAGVLFLMSVFAALIAIDAYLFYTVRAREAIAEPSPASVPVLTAEDIDAATKLIDRRAEEYEALLNEK